MKTRVIIIGILLSCFLACLWFWNRRDPAILRFDGVYQTERLTSPATGHTFYTYLRFFPDGKVAFISIAEEGSTGAPQKIRKELAGAQSSPIDAPFSQKGRSVRFSAIHPAGLVDYDGKIGMERIHFFVHSRINGVNGEDDFTFYPFEPTKTP